MAFSSPIAGHAQSIALTTVPFNTAWFSVPNVKVVALQGMTSIAVSLLRIVGAYIRVATSKVLLHRDDFHVSGIHTGAIATEMVNLHPRRDRAIGFEVGPSVGLESLSDSKPTAGHVEIPVAVFVQAGLPNPALTRLVDFAPETLGDGFWLRASNEHDSLLSHTSTKGRR